MVGGGLGVKYFRHILQDHSFPLNLGNPTDLVGEGSLSKIMKGRKEIYIFFVFLGLLLQHMQVPRLGVKLEL